MGLIYKITNKKNLQSYVGKTSRTLNIRLGEHKRDCENYSGTHIALYNAIKKYGWDEFTIEVLEDNIPNEKLNEKEQYYISFYDTYKSGYNGTPGGDGGRTASKLTEQEVDQIINILSDNNNLQSYSTIGDYFNISASVINQINKGEAWRKDNIQYPIRQYNVAGLTISKQVYSCIVNDLLHSNLELNEIANKYKISEEQMTNINQGYRCYNNKNLYYSGIYKGSYPIRPVKNKKLNLKDCIQEVLKDILFTKDSMGKIGKKYNIAGNTLQYIQSGKRQKELTKDFVTPLRKNIIENQKIYLSLYDDNKGDD